MRGRAAVLLMVAIFLIPMGLACTVDEADAAPDSTVFTGTVYFEKSPVRNTEVLLNWNISDESKDVWYGTVTNFKGEFTVSLPVSADKDDIPDS